VLGIRLPAPDFRSGRINPRISLTGASGSVNPKSQMKDRKRKIENDSKQKKEAGHVGQPEKLLSDAKNYVIVVAYKRGFSRGHRAVSVHPEQ
jgi:hypothetical protein